MNVKLNIPNIVFEPLARAMFCKASSCRICIAAGEARIYIDQQYGRVRINEWNGNAHIGSLPHKLGGVDFGSSGDKLRSAFISLLHYPNLNLLD
jgi:hypothetical protein